MKQDNFSKQAETYARYRPAYPDAMYDFILQHSDEKECAWDCGTGSGQVAVKLSRYFNKVIATDISEQQLQFAPQKENIRYVKVPAEEADFPDHSFDLITVAQAIHWFDLEAFYKQVRRTVKPGSTGGHWLWESKI